MGVQMKVILYFSSLILLFGNLALAEMRLSGDFSASCLSPDNLVMGEVTYIVRFGETIPTGVWVNFGNVSANLGCNTSVTACAGISEIDGNVVTASVNQKERHVFNFDFKNLSFSCVLPVE